MMNCLFSSYMLFFIFSVPCKVIHIAAYCARDGYEATKWKQTLCAQSSGQGDFFS